jgi:HlyD family secretion protein/macrolide-specific efflux system membrane fusion protein
MKKLLFLLLLLAAGAGIWYWQFKPEEARTRVLETAEAQTHDVRKILEATGIIKSQVGAQVKIGARATGVIDRMLVKVGDRVSKGDLIAVIDSREIKAQEEETQARLERNEAELDRVEETFPLRIEEARADVDAAQAQAEYARLTVQRQRRLVDQDLAAQDALDDALQAYEVAVSNLESARASLARTKAEFEKELKKARKAVAETEAALQTIDIRRSYTRIHSPLTGVVSQVTAQEGETVVSGLQVSNLITVLDPTRLEMWIYVDETDVGQVETDMPVEFTVDAYPDTVFTGQIDQIYPEPEIRDNIVYYQAIVTLDPGHSGRLRPEMTTQCRIIVEERNDVLAIPNRALKWVGGSQKVFRVTGQGEAASAEPVEPEFGLMGYEYAQVLSGLAEGDTVATQIVIPEGEDGQAQGGQNQRGGGRR